jgi:hypothetical protein
VLDQRQNQQLCAALFQFPVKQFRAHLRAASESSGTHIDPLSPIIQRFVLLCPTEEGVGRFTSISVEPVRTYRGKYSTSVQ